MRVKWFIIFIVLTVVIETGIYYASLLMFPDMLWLDMLFIVSGSIFVLSLFLASSGGIYDKMIQISMRETLLFSSLPFKEEQKVTTIRINPILVGSSLFLLVCFVLAVI